MLRAVLVAGAVSCVGCGPYCGLAGPGGSYYVTIRSSLGTLPPDLVIDFRERSSDEVFRGAELPTDGTWRKGGAFSCALVGVDGGVAPLSLSTATSVSCSAFSYGGDTSVTITGTGLKTFMSFLHNGSDCQGQDVSADYVLVP